MGIRSLYNFFVELIEEEKKIKKYKEKNIMLGKETVIDKYSTIGEYTYIGDYSRIGKSHIGRYTSIGDFCIIGPGEHRIKNVSSSYLLYKSDIGSEYYDGDDGHRAGGVIIGNDVWVGANSIVRRGVKIGDGAVIGAHSFVNNDIPDFAVAVGCPAKIIKYRFSNKIQEEIKESQWWNENVEEAKKAINSINAY